MVFSCFSAEEEELTILDNAKKFIGVHWKGVCVLLAPLIAILICVPDFEPYKLCGAVLVLMAVYWVCECIPLPVTAFFPIMLFPLLDIMSSVEVCRTYSNDTIIMFYTSIVMAYAIEQSGLHVRMALGTIRLVGYSHYKILFAIGIITMFVSMFLTNTAATTMMVPTVFAILKVFEDQGLLKTFEKNSNGDTVASDMTTCYFCMVAYSASIGGLGTLIGTATNLTFKGLFTTQYPAAPELISFPKFSMLMIPPMLVMEIITYLSFIFMYFGWLRPGSELAKKAKVPPKALEMCKKKVQADSKKIGRITFWELSSGLLFFVGILLFFCRSPQIFTGWGDFYATNYKSSPKGSAKDSLVGSLISFMMMLWPANLKICNNFRAKKIKNMPVSKTKSVIDWDLKNRVCPYSFLFLLGGGFALSTAAKKEYTNLNGEIGQFLKQLESLPTEAVILILITFTIFLTNFASNVAVANVVCPISMSLAEQIKKNPLMFVIATGISSSMALLLPVGTPPNLVVQSAALIPTSKMIKSGAIPTLGCIFAIFITCAYYSPVVWSDIKTVPAWALPDNQPSSRYDRDFMG